MMKHTVACAGAVLALGATALAERVDLAVYMNAGAPGSAAGVSTWVDVLNGGNNKVNFVFHNDSTGTAGNAVITKVFFEDTGFTQATLSNPVVEEKPGIGFVNHGNNPSGKIKGFGGPWGGNILAVRSDNPVLAQGIGVGETMTITFDFTGPFQAILDALKTPGEFRIAQHIHGLPQNGHVWMSTMSEAQVVPLPAAAWLGAAGLAGLGLLRVSRRR